MSSSVGPFLNPASLENKRILATRIQELATELCYQVLQANSLGLEVYLDGRLVEFPFGSIAVYEKINLLAKPEPAKLTSEEQQARQELEKQDRWDELDQLSSEPIDPAEAETLLAGGSG